MASTAFIALITLTLFMIVSYAANSGCNGVEYDISGKSYFEPADACINNVVYFCDGDILKRQPCTLQSYYGISNYVTDDSAVITTDICAAITTEKNANSCETYCDGESCSAVVETTYPIIQEGTATCSQCVTDSNVLCQYYWFSSSPLDDIAAGATTQTVHMTGRCVDSTKYSCEYTEGWSAVYRASKSEYAQTDCTGNATSTTLLARDCIDDETASGTPTQPITYGCYVYQTAAPTEGPTTSTNAPSGSPTVFVPTTTNPTRSPVPSPTKSPSKHPTATLRVPFTFGAVATVYELTMSWDDTSITLHEDDEIYFSDPGPGKAVTVTLRYNYDASSESLYCPGCSRQVLFQVGDGNRDCDEYYSGNKASEVALTSTYTSDGSTRQMNIAIDLHYYCSTSQKVPNSYIGVIKGTPYPTEVSLSPTNAPSAPSVQPTTATPTTPSVPPTTSAPSVPSVPPSNAPSDVPTGLPSTPPSDDAQSDDSNGSGGNAVQVLFVCTVIALSVFCY